jgi:UDP-glucose 4-epimerase
VFGKGLKTPYAEDDDVVLGSTSKSRWSYAVSKMVDECLGFAYHREYGLPVVMARLFNTVGPRQRGRYGMVIPRMMRQALEGRPITVFGDGAQSRCFCDVRDIVQAIWMLTASPAAQGKLFSIGSQSEISILDLARKIRTVARSHSEIVRIPYEQAYGEGFEDMERRVPDTTKIARCIGWRPRIGLDQTLQQVREWCLTHAESESGLRLEASNQKERTREQLLSA